MIIPPTLDEIQQNVTAIFEDRNETYSVSDEFLHYRRCETSDGSQPFYFMYNFTKMDRLEAGIGEETGNVRIT